jgi:hypothetical protein
MKTRHRKRNAIKVPLIDHTLSRREVQVHRALTLF